MTKSFGMLIRRRFPVLSVFLLIAVASGAQVQLDIYYPEALLSVASPNQTLFFYGLSSIPYVQPDSAGFFGNFSSNAVRNSTHWVAPNHWRVLADVGTYTGTLYAILTASGLSSVSTCTQGLAGVWGPECIPRLNPHQTSIEVSDGDRGRAAAVAMYPSFDYSGSGIVEVALTDFPSVTLGNTRNVSIFYPYSVLENTVGRPLQLLVLLDGDFTTVSLLAAKGGIGSLIDNGDLPETIVVGVPCPATGTHCNASEAGAGRCRQRNYELTPTACDPSLGVPQCGGVDWTPTGGGDVFLDFVEKEVIPAVMTRVPRLRNNGFSVADVAIAGYSLGGLMACYAAGTRAGFFTRGLCQSPSVYYNDGQLVAMIAAAFTRNGGVVPKSVVVTVGSQENSPLKGDKYWLAYCLETIQAFVRLGMGTGMGMGTGVPVHPDGNPSPSLTQSNAALLYWEGGMHSLNQWLQLVGYALPFLFQYDFPGGALHNRVQRDFNIQWIYPSFPPAPASSGDGFTRSQVVVAATVPSVLLGLVLLAVCMHWHRSGGPDIKLCMRRRQRNEEEGVSGAYGVAATEVPTWPGETNKLSGSLL